MTLLTLKYLIKEGRDRKMEEIKPKKKTKRKTRKQ